MVRVPVLWILLLLPAGAKPFLPDTASRPDTLSGTIIGRKEIWDRRTNPLMGRPDILEEIRWTVLDTDSAYATVSVRGRELLLKNRAVRKGSRGIFIVTARDTLCDLVSFEPAFLSPPPDPPAPPPPAPVKQKPREPWEQSGRELKNSPEEQARMVRLISERFGFTDGEFVYAVSHQGPRPPRGGYVYWGVRGLKNGAWHIWQYNAEAPRPGRELDIPHKYSK